MADRSHLYTDMIGSLKTILRNNAGAISQAETEIANLRLQLAAAQSNLETLQVDRADTVAELEGVISVARRLADHKAKRQREQEDANLAES